MVGGATGAPLLRHENQATNCGRSQQFLQGMAAATCATGVSAPGQTCATLLSLLSWTTTSTRLPTASRWLKRSCTRTRSCTLDVRREHQSRAEKCAHECAAHDLVDADAADDASVVARAQRCGPARFRPTRDSGIWPRRPLLGATAERVDQGTRCRSQRPSSHACAPCSRARIASEKRGYTGAGLAIGASMNPLGRTSLHGTGV